MRNYLLMLLIVMSTLSIIPTYSQCSENWLSAKGNKIIDINGDEVRLTGVNWFGFETQVSYFHGIWNRDMFESLQQIKDLGFNSIRVPWANEIIFGNKTISVPSGGRDPISGNIINTELTNVKTPLELMDALIDWCQANDLKIVLDNHTRKPDSHTSEKLWYTANYSEKQWIEDWVFLANRYKDKSSVVMMDLNNEPNGEATWGNQNPETDWNKAAERCGNAILAVNPNVMIMAEGIGVHKGDSYWWGGNLQGAKEYPIELSIQNKLIYSAHEYGPEVHRQKWFFTEELGTEINPNFPANMRPLWEKNFDFIYEQNIGPMLIGEFGIRDNSNDSNIQDKVRAEIARTWIEEFLKFRGKEYSWTYWCWNPNSGDTGGILKDDWSTVNQWKIDILKPYFANPIPNCIAPKVLSVTDFSKDKTIGLTAIPNPSKGPVTISSSKTAINNITVFDLLGRKVQALEGLDEQTATINIDNLAKGLYVLRVESNNRTYTTKLIKN